MQNASLRDNILFHQPFDAAKYDAVVHACALRSDFAQLAAGDETVAGLRGINLSGGQRQRVNLARAAYFDADVVLLDAPLRRALLPRCCVLWRGLLDRMDAPLASVARCMRADVLVVLMPASVIAGALHANTCLALKWQSLPAPCNLCMLACVAAHTAGQLL